MAQVFIPPMLRGMTNNQAVVTADGKNVRQVIENLDAQFPGIKAHLVQDDQLRPGLSVVVGGAMSSRGLLASVEADSEVHFLPALGGG
jgi:molybdopterin synthase sulfur carrier subunit